MWTTAYILTLLFFLIQFGTGCAVLSIAPPTLIEAYRMTKAQFLVLSTTIGASTTGILLGLLSLLVSGIWFHFGIVLAIAAFGLTLTWRFWRPSRSDVTVILAWGALSFPIALMTWWWSFGAFSDFPYGDIGADVHWMKTAQEYADSGVINPFAVQSYIDLRSSLAGVLAGTVGLDLLQFSWPYRYFSILFVLLAYYAFASGIYTDPTRKWIMFSFAAAGNTMALLTNGSLALTGSVVFLGCLLGQTAPQTGDTHQFRSIALLLLAAATSLLVVFALNNNTLALALIIAGLAILRIRGTAGKQQAILMMGGLWPTTLLLAHRGSYLFVPTVIGVWLCYLLIRYAIARQPTLSMRVLRLVSVLLPLTIAGIVGCILAMRLGWVEPANANTIFSGITALLLGRKIENGDELFLGAGPQVAFIELARAMGPLFAICIGLAVALWWFRSLGARRDLKADDAKTAHLSLLVWSWTAACGLSLAVLSGFPFLYRITMIVLAMLAITATETFCQLLVDTLPTARYQRVFAAIIVSVLTAGFVLTFYAFSWFSNASYASYQAFLRPTELAALVLIFGLVPLTLNRSSNISVASLVGILGLGIAVDRAGLASITRPYSFGPLPNDASQVSHYSTADLATARWVHRNLKSGIVLSDPYTMGMLQALTGTPGAYLFSNLDTVNEAIARRAKAVLSAVLQTGAGNRQVASACNLAAPLLQEINQETYFQMRRSDALSGILRPVRDTKAPRGSHSTPAQSASTNLDVPNEQRDKESNSTVRDLLNDRDSAWSLVVIITPRTIKWTQLASNQRLGYFPPTSPIDPQLLDTIRGSTFQILYSNAQSAVVRLPCEK
jgi:hypothetical protein